jgi:hypothetical protein
VIARLVNVDPPLDPVNGRDTVVLFTLEGLPIVGTSGIVAGVTEEDAVDGSLVP